MQRASQGDLLQSTVALRLALRLGTRSTGCRAFGDLPKKLLGPWPSSTPLGAACDSLPFAAFVSLAVFSLLATLSREALRFFPRDLDLRRFETDVVVDIALA